MEPKRKIVGYFEGTDPQWLTTVVAKGYDTLPLSNGVDTHGMNVRLLNRSSQVELVVGYLHKVVAHIGYELTTSEILHACQSLKIPVLLVVPKELQNEARERVGNVTDIVKFLDPSEILQAMLDILSE